MGDEKRDRRQFLAEDKAQAVRRHVLGGETVSSICEGLGIAPNQFYRWQKELFDHAAAAFDVKSQGRRADGRTTQLERENERLRGQLAHKDTVIAEVTEEYVRLKKTLGQP
jgi:transposase-like protein